MKKLNILILLFTLITGQAIAQNVSFKAKWEKGDNFKYYLFYNKYNPKNKEYKANQDTTVIHFKVLETTSDNFLLEMKYDLSKRAPQPFPAKGLNKVVEEVQQKPILLLLDSNGKFTSIKNWQEVKQRCLAEIASQKTKAKKEDKELWDYWKTKMQTEADIEAFFVDDIEFFFMLYGSNLRNNAAIDYEDVIVYKESMPANTHLVTKQDSVDASLVKVQLYTLPDTKKAAEQLHKYREMAKQQEDNPDAIPYAYLFDLQDYYEFVNATSTGTHKKALYLRYLKTGSKELIEQWEFKLVP